MAALVYFLICMAMVGGGVYLFVRGKRNAESELVSGRLAGAAIAVDKKHAHDWLSVQLERAGLSISVPQQRLLLGILAIVVAMVAIFSIPLAVLVLFSVLAFAYTALTLLYKRRQQRVVSQLPRFLDQVQRSMQIGKTLGDAIMLAIDSCEDPLQEILLKVKRNITLGVSLPDAFQTVADDYAIQEMQILALGMRVNFRFGGSMTEFIANIIAFIREREKMQRELRAMTGETRVSAVVLSIVPVAIASYILFKNPSYLINMWNDASGKNMIVLALSLQVAGMLVIWRMMKSI